MKRRFLAYLITCCVGLLCFAGVSHAQFKEDIYAQDPDIKPSAGTQADTTKMFSFKEYFGGLAHKNTIKIGHMFAGSMVLPGTAQIYNKQYWKLPIVYTGIGAFAGTGGYYLHQYSKTKKALENWEIDKKDFEDTYGGTYSVPMPELDLRAKKTGTWLMVGAGLVYWGSLMDGVVNYQADEHPHPGRATLYSLLLPGLGQIYNGELYKVPIYWGGLLVSVHCLTTNHTNYIRFKTIHNEATTSKSYSGPISGETAKWYRDVYRRYRDYSIVATALVYFLQVIDANVFAYMHDFEVTDDISMNIEPTIIAPDNAYALGGGGFNSGQNAVGLKMGLRF
jgi:hypothetical protein